MSVLTLSGLRSEARLIAQDNASGTTNFGLSDTNWNTLLNQAMYDAAALYPEHFTYPQETWTPSAWNGTTLFKDWSPTQTDFEVRRLLGVEWDDNQIGSFTVLERIELHRMHSLQRSNATAGIPTRWALLDLNTNATLTTKTNTFRLYFHQIPASGTHNALVTYEFYPKLLSADGDYPRGFRDAESRWIARLAAARGAYLLGRDEDFIRNIFLGLPENWQTHEEVRRGLLAPKPRPLESAL